MSLRILVDENTSPRLVAHLREAGHDASHVLDTLGEGASDGQIVFASAPPFSNRVIRWKTSGSIPIVTDHLLRQRLSYRVGPLDS